MYGIYTRHRPLALLAAVVLAQVLLLAFQIKRAHDVRLIRYWAVELISPVERAGTWTFSRVGGFWSGYVALHNARAENRRLQSELDQLRLRNAELETQAAEGQRLSALLGFRDAHAEAPMLAAQVIGASPDPASLTLFINRGERDHLRRNMPVITPDGIVGKVVEVFPATAQILLITDKDSGVGALFAESRVHGVLKGTGDPQPRMEYIVNTEKIHAGDLLLTSGEDRIFPKGLLVGKVADAAQGNPFQVIHVEPAAHLDRLEDVLVLLTQQELAPKKVDESPVVATPESPAQTAAPAAQPPAAAAPVKPKVAKPPAETQTPAPAAPAPENPPAPQQ
jgi:rod shape-determining protein MreC